MAQPRDAAGRFTSAGGGGGGGGEELTFSLFGIDVNASRTLREVGREADRTARALTQISMTAIAGGAAMSALLVAASGTGQLLAAMAPAAMLAVPAIASLAQGMTVLKLASDGVKKQFEQLRPALDGLKAVASEAIAPGIQSFIDAMKTNLPVVREGVKATATVFGDLAREAGAAFSGEAFRADLGVIMSANTGILRNLGQAALEVARAFVDIMVVAGPMLETLTLGITETATKFREWAAGARESGEMAQMLSTAMSVIGDVASIVGNILGAVGNVLGAIGSTVVEMLGPIRGLTQEFQDWTNIPENLAPLVGMVQGFRDGLSGAFDAIRNGTDGMGGHVSTIFLQIGDALRDLLPVVGQLIAALVSALLPTLVQLIPPVAAFAQAFGMNLASAVRDLTPTLVTVAMAFADILAALEPLLPDVAALAVAVISLAGPLAEVAAQLVTALAPVLQALIPIVTQIVGLLGDMLVTALTTLANAITPLMPQLTSMVETIGNALVNALLTLEPLWTTLVQAFADLLVALVPLLPGLVQLGVTVGTAIVNALVALAPLIPPIVDAWEQMATALAPLLPQLVSIADQLGRAILDAINQLVPILPQFIENWVQLMKALAPLLPALIDLVQNFVDLLEAITPLIGPLAELAALLIGTVLQAFTTVIGIIVSTVTALTTLYTTLMGPVIAALGAAATAIGSLVSAMTSMADGVISKGRELLGWFQALPGAIRGYFAGSGTWLFSAGGNLIQGLINGIVSKAGAVARAMGDIASRARGFLPFSPAKEGPFAGTGNPWYSGRSIMRQLAAGLSENARFVDTAMAQVAGRVQAPLMLAGQAAWSGGFGPSAVAGGGITVNLSVNVAGSAVVERELGEKLAPIVQRVMATTAGSNGRRTGLPAR